MELIALSSPESTRKEAEHISRLFEAGLNAYHLRKPGLPLSSLQKILDALEPDNLARVVLHSHPALASRYQVKGIHLGSSYHKPGVIAHSRKMVMAFRYRKMERSITCHSLNRLENTKNGYTALVLSPVFSTISDHNISAGFDEARIRASLRKVDLPVYALGGIDGRTILQAKSMGFQGAILQGALWRQQDPVQALLEIRQSLRQTPREIPALSVVKTAHKTA